MIPKQDFFHFYVRQGFRTGHAALQCIEETHVAEQSAALQDADPTALVTMSATVATHQEALDALQAQRDALDAQAGPALPLEDKLQFVLPTTIRLAFNPK